MANKNDIELVIRATDLTTKPLRDIDKAVSDLTAAFDQIAPSAKKGEASLTDLTKISGQLEKALKGLQSNQATLELFKNLSVQMEAAKAATEGFAARVDIAARAMDGVTKPTKAMKDELRTAERELKANQQEIDRLAKRMDTLGEKAQKMGLNLKDAAQSNALIESAVSKAVPAYKELNSIIEAYSERQAAAAKAAKAAQAEIDFKKQAESAQSLVKASEYVNWWTEALNKRDEEAKRAQATIDFNEQARKAQELVKAADYVNFWVTALDELDKKQAASDQQKLDLANFNKIGTDAKKAADSVKLYTAQADKLDEANIKAGNSIKGIVDPAAQMVQTISGLEEATRSAVATQAEYSKSIRTLGQSTIDARKGLNDLERVQGAAVAIGTLIDKFTAVEKVTTQAREEFVKAKQNVLDLARAIETADTPNVKLVEDLKAAQAQLAATESRYRKFSTALADMDVKLRASGVDVNNLSGEMNRITSVAEKSAKAMRSYAESVELARKNAKGGANIFSLFNTGGRTTLSLFQRLRGEVLALTASYVGLFGAIQEVESVLKSVDTRAATQSRLSNAFGGAQAGRELEYIAVQADRLGIELPQLSDSYSKLAVAAKSAGLSTEQTRYIFESFSEVSKVFSLSIDDTQGVFKALEQIMSKGSVQAEELRGQLGDRLTGAFYEFAKSLKLTTQDLNSWIKTGKVSSDTLLLFAKDMRDKVAPQLDEATKRSSSEIARFRTAIYQLQLSVADSGFLNEFTKAVQQLTAYLKSSDGKEAATKFGQALASIAKGVQYLITNIDDVVRILKIFGATIAAVKIIGFVGDILSAVSAIKEFATANALLTASLVRLGAATASFGAGFKLGEWLNENSVTVRASVQIIIGSFDYLFKAILGGSKIFLIENQGVWEDSFAFIYNVIIKFIRESVSALANLANKLGFDEIAASLTDKVSGLVDKKIIGFGERTKKLRQELESELTRIKGVINDTFAAEQYAQDHPVPKPTTTAPSAPGTAPTNASANTTTLSPEELKRQQDQLAAIKAQGDAKFQELEKNLQAKLASIQERYGIKTAQTLEERLKVVDEKYKSFYDQLNAYAKKGVNIAPAKDSLDTIVNLEKQLATQKYIDDQRKATLKEVKKAEQEVNGLVQARNDLINAVQAQEASGAISNQEATQKLKDIQDQYSQSIGEAADHAIALAEAVKDPALTDQMTIIAEKMKATKASAEQTTKPLLTQKQILTEWASGLTNVASAFAKAVGQSGKLSDGFKAAGQAFRAFAAQFLQQIATMILQQAILNALRGNPFTAGAASAASAALPVTPSVYHSGGTVSLYGAPTRTVSPDLFIGARRYHAGTNGTIGLKKDEVPSILQVGEEVLSKTDPRNIRNGGGASQQDTTIINAVDALSFVNQALQSVEGKRTILNVIRANKRNL